ncbi:MAG: acylphosphatase [Rhodothermales bacterium]
MPRGIEKLEVRIIGRVQGVGFRHFTTQQARRLGVDGWVRNEPDGSVRVVAEGSKDALDELLDRLQEGPATARVDEVGIERSAGSGGFSGFMVRYH